MSTDPNGAAPSSSPAPGAAPASAPSSAAPSGAPPANGAAAPAASAPAAPVVPDQYSFSLKDSKGNPLELDSDATAAFVPVLKKLGITQEQASGLAEVFVKELERQDSVLTEQYTAQRDSWENLCKQDKEFGGEKFDANVAVAQKAIAAFGNDALKQLLNETGLGNHPEVVRFFYKVGQKLGEDGRHIPGGNQAAGAEQDIAAKLFTHPTSQHQQ